MVTLVSMSYYVSLVSSGLLQKAEILVRGVIILGNGTDLEILRKNLSLSYSLSLNKIEVIHYFSETCNVRFNRNPTHHQQN